ncbi:MAG: 2'-5' RNA ligase family protein [Bowdeniella nasicola]|nr:2'-5' RNA ligase family protein [Bowdeniella nasicola]
MVVHACVIAPVTAPLGELISAQRHALQLPNVPPQPHLTLLPPVVFHHGDESALIEQVRTVARAHHRIELQVAGVATFAPTTPVVYFPVTGDLKAIQALHRDLTSPYCPGDFRYPYIPHVTLTWLPTATAARRVADTPQLAQFRGQCTLSHLVVVVGQLPDRWETIAEIALPAPQRSGLRSVSSA